MDAELQPLSRLPRRWTLGLLAITGIRNLPIGNLPIGNLRSLAVCYCVPPTSTSYRVRVGVSVGLGLGLVARRNGNRNSTNRYSADLESVISLSPNTLLWLTGVHMRCEFANMRSDSGRRSG